MVGRDGVPIEPGKYLVYEANCRTCQQVAKTFESVVGRRMRVLPSSSPESTELLSSVGLYHFTRPVLVVVSSKSSRPFTGIGLLWQIIRTLGPRHALALLSALNTKQWSPPPTTRAIPRRAVLFSGAALPVVVVLSPRIASLLKATSATSTVDQRTPLPASALVAQVRSSAPQVAAALRAFGPLMWDNLNSFTLTARNGTKHESWLVPFASAVGNTTLTYLMLVNPSHPGVRFAVVERLQHLETGKGGRATLTFYRPSGPELGSLAVEDGRLQVIRITSSRYLGVDLHCLFGCLLREVDQDCASACVQCAAGGNRVPDCTVCITCAGPHFYFCYKECS